MPRLSDLENNDRRKIPHPTTIQKRFGSFGNALCEAGLKYEDGRLLIRKYADNELIDLLRYSSVKLGGIPRGRYLRHWKGFPAVDTYRRRFGTFDHALDIAFPGGVLVKVRFCFLPIRAFLFVHRLLRKLRLANGKKVLTSDN